jgi:hypothetical protein
MKTCRKVHNLRWTYFYLNVNNQHCINKWTLIAMNWLTFSSSNFWQQKNLRSKLENNHFGIQMFDKPLKFLSNISKTNKTIQENPSNQNKLFLTTKHRKSVYQNGMQIKIEQIYKYNQHHQFEVTYCIGVTSNLHNQTSVQVEKSMEIIIQRWYTQSKNYTRIFLTKTIWKSITPGHCMQNWTRYLKYNTKADQNTIRGWRNATRISSWCCIKMRC